MAGLLANDARARLNLLGKLAGGGHNKHENALALGGMAKTIERGEQERGRLAGAGLGGRHDVAALEHCRDGTALHRRGLLVAHLGNGSENLLGQSELVKAGYFVGVHVQTSNLCPANAKPGGGKVPGTPRLQGRMGCSVRKRRGVQAALGTFPGARPLRNGRRSFFGTGRSKPHDMGARLIGQPRGRLLRPEYTDYYTAVAPPNSPGSPIRPKRA